MQPEQGGMPTPHPQGIPMVNPTPLDHKTTVTGAQFPVVEQGEDGQSKMVLKDHIIVFHSTPAGTAVMVWALDVAEKISLDVYAAIRRMKSNLIVPGDGSNLREISRDMMNKALEEREVEYPDEYDQLEEPNATDET